MACNSVYIVLMCHIIALKLELPAIARDSLIDYWMKSSGDCVCFAGMFLLHFSTQPDIFHLLNQKEIMYFFPILQLLLSSLLVIVSGCICIISKIFLPVKCREYGSRDLLLKKNVCPIVLKMETNFTLFATCVERWLDIQPPENIQLKQILVFQH